MPAGRATTHEAQEARSAARHADGVDDEPEDTPGAGETRPPPENRYFFGSSFFTASALPGTGLGDQKSGSAEAICAGGVPSLGLTA